MLSLFCPEGVSILYLCLPLSCSSKLAIDKKICLQFTLPTILSEHNVPSTPPLKHTRTHKFCTKTAALPLDPTSLGLIVWLECQTLCVN